MKQGILICGLGTGNIGQITKETMDLLTGSRPVYFRTAVHPIVAELVSYGVRFTAFDDDYEAELSFEALYEKIVNTLISAGKTAEIVYAVPGHPMCGESTVQGLISACRAENLPYRIFSAVSFIDACLTAVEKDPIEGLTVLDALMLPKHIIGHQNALLITQVYNRHIAGEVKLILGEYYPDETQVALITAHPDSGEEQVIWRHLYEIDRDETCNHLTTLYMPPQEKDYRNITALLDIMTDLRAPKGCPWDRAQTHESLRTYLLEETYEVLDAIDRQDYDNLIEELGDLLYQIVFHAEIGREKGYFDFGDIAEGICKKMLRRHPHVFGHVQVASDQELNAMWNQIKGEEKKNRSEKSKDGFDIPASFPALMRSVKMHQKIRRGGCCPEEFQSATEEIQDALSALMVADNKDERFSIFGKLLFALCRYAAENGLDAELALKQAADHFEQRYFALRHRLDEEKRRLQDLGQTEQAALWQTISD